MPEMSRETGNRIWQNVTPSSEAQTQIKKSGKKVYRSKSGKDPREEFPRKTELDERPSKNRVCGRNDH